MTIVTKLNQKDFINVSFLLFFRQRVIKILIGIFAVFVVSTLISLMLSQAEISTVIFPFLFITILPLMTYFSAKKNYASNKRISETIEYRFEQETLFITGESFSSQLSWDKLHKLTLHKNWVLIWQSPQIANAIPTRDVSSNQIAELKSILNRHNVKNNL